MPEPIEEHNFARTLAQALRDHPASLEQLSGQLANRGTPISMATLSYWSSGRSVPTRAKSIQAVQHLEGLLDLPPGALIGTLEARDGSAWTPSIGIGEPEEVRRATEELGFAMDRRVDPQVMTDAVTVSDGLHRLTVESVQLHLALGNRVDRLLALLPRPSDGARLVRVESDRGARTGRSVDLPRSRTVVMEMLLDTPLVQGDVGQFRHLVEWEDTAPIRAYERRLPIGLRYLSLDVRVPLDQRPAKGSMTWPPSVSVVRAEGLPMPLPASCDETEVQVVRADAKPGVYRVCW